MSLNPQLTITFTCTNIIKQLQGPNNMLTITLQLTGGDANYPMDSVTENLTFNMVEGPNSDQFVVGQAYTATVQ